ncbi:MAG TPA: hypothetical protein VGP76_02520 [Planctomycetaceae bacterium]|jgi:hypothetical protein|nr:hypothetical protein [Planctomycetaceae bacterium]
MSDKQLECEFESRLAARKKWHDRKGEIHPLKALAIVYAVLVGVPLLASIISPWTAVAFRRLFG